MERALRWLLPILLLVEAALVWLDLLSLRDAAVVVVALEVLLLAVGGRQLFVVARRYRAGRTKGLDAWGALEDGLAVLLPARWRGSS